MRRSRRTGPGESQTRTSGSYHTVPRGRKASALRPGMPVVPPPRSGCCSISSLFCAWSLHKKDNHCRDSQQEKQIIYPLHRFIFHRYQIWAGQAGIFTDAKIDRKNLLLVKSKQNFVKINQSGVGLRSLTQADNPDRVLSYCCCGVCTVHFSGIPC